MPAGDGDEVPEQARRQADRLRANRTAAGSHGPGPAVRPSEARRRAADGHPPDGIGRHQGALSALVSSWRDLVVVGGSAGAIEALQRLVGCWPPDLAAAVLVVVHTRSTDSSLADVLARGSALPADMAHDGELLEPGRIVVAPGGRHLTVDGDRVRLELGPDENMARPSIDVLFRSAAEARGAGVVGVVLSGMLDDGTAGLAAIRRAGGVALVQDPADALCPHMPESAVRFAHPHAVLPADGLATAVVAAIQGSVVGSGEAAVRLHDDDTMGAGHEDRQLSGLTCPQCGGTMWDDDIGGVLRLECRTGHVLAQDTMAAEQARLVEDALYAALRALEEQASLARRLAERFRRRGEEALARRHDRRADDSLEQAQVLRESLLGNGPPEPQ